MIRKLQTEDLDQVLAIWLEGNCAAHDFIPEAYWKDQFGTVKERLPKAEVSIYETDGAVQGFIGLTDQYIAGIFVSGGAQSRGIGKQLLDHVKQTKDNLTLHVYRKNERAVRFYQREQFKIQSEQVDESTGEREFLMQWKR